MNRVADRIAKNTVLMAEKAKTLSQEKLDKADRELVLDFSDHFRFQELKNEAWLTGKLLNQEEAQTIYNYLGETVSVFNSQTLPVRYTLMGILGELAQWKAKQIKLEAEMAQKAGKKA